MKNIKKALPILLVMVPLLMANSPSPYPYINEYKDFSHTAIELVSSDADLQKYVYQTTITNDGDGYISLNYTYLYEYRELIASASEDYDLYLAPTKTSLVNFTLNKEVAVIESLSVSCAGFSDYQLDTFATYTNPSAFKKEGDGTYGYTYLIDAELEYDEDYTYSVLISYTYDETQYVTREGYISSDGSGVYFTNREDLDVSKMTLEEIIFVKGNQRSFIDLGSIFMYIFLGLIGGIVGLGIIVALIVLAVFGIVYAVKGSRKKKVDSE